jgi:DNA-binding CsgD family transcriptional regulator
MAKFDPNKKVTALMKKIYPTLTDRESQCLFWTCLNLTKKEVGSRLAISENTVKYYLKTAIEKQEVPAMRDIKTAFLANVVIYALFDARQGMKGDTL